MDAVFLIVTIISLCVIVASAFFLFKKTDSGKRTVRSNRNNEEAQGQNEQLGRRARMLRNRGARIQQQNTDNHEEPENDQQDEPAVDLDKLGAKKKAKLEAKAERKHQREVEEHARQEKKKRDEQQQEERRRAEEKELELQRQQEAEEKRLREEKEKRDHEEYLRMKEAFSVEEEGFDDYDTNNETNLLEEFVSFIKKQKVVVVEDLAMKFKLKTQTAIDRIKDLQSDGILTGVIDDRGKFIYISPEEMKSIVKFIRQRGRVSIQELAENSNVLINLAPVSP